MKQEDNYDETADAGGSFGLRTIGQNVVGLVGQHAAEDVEIVAG